MADLPAASANAAVNAILVAATVYYLSLHTADPGTTGASEVTGGSYARQPISVGAGVSGTATSSDAQSFTNMPAVAGGVWIGIWSAATGGTFLWGHGSASIATAIPAGATIDYATGAVTATISG